MFNAFLALQHSQFVKKPPTGGTSQQIWAMGSPLVSKGTRQAAISPQVWCLSVMKIGNRLSPIFIVETVFS